MELSILQPGMVVAERFELISQLGCGGMGEVWLAHHAGLAVPCAIKFISRLNCGPSNAYLGELRTRFQREAQTAARLRSNHVVQILDYGTWRGVPYIAMEFLKGEDLATRIKRLYSLSAEQTLSITRDVAQALGQAQRLGIVHRDLKPDNIFLVPEGDRVVAKVLDFGVAKAPPIAERETACQTKTGAQLGTPNYMSPEQIEGAKDVDLRSDLWALAIVVFECLTGTMAYHSKSVMTLFSQICHEPVTPPCSLVPSLPRAFDAWCARATAKLPDQRFQTPSEFIEALRRALQGESNSATTTSNPPIWNDETEAPTEAFIRSKRGSLKPRSPRSAQPASTTPVWSDEAEAPTEALIRPNREVEPRSTTRS